MKQLLIFYKPLLIDTSQKENTRSINNFKQAFPDIGIHFFSGAKTNKILKRFYCSIPIDSYTLKLLKKSKRKNENYTDTIKRLLQTS